jgi:hypothetical protein
MRCVGANLRHVVRLSIVMFFPKVRRIRRFNRRVAGWEAIQIVKFHFN